MIRFPSMKFNSTSIGGLYRGPYCRACNGRAAKHSTQSMTGAVGVLGGGGLGGTKWMVMALTARSAGC